LRDGYTGVRRRRSPILATFLSFLWPGLGQWYAGSGRSAVIFALPVVAVAAVVLVQVLSGPTSVVVSLFDPTTALTILVLIGLLGLWRLISMGDAMTGAERDRSWRQPRPLAAFAGLALVVVVVHVAAANLAWSFYDAGSHIFVAQEGPDLTVQPSASSPTSGYVASPAATPETRESRINFLLTGIDSSATRNHSLTDTLLVVSVDPETGKVAMVSFPRDIARFPLSNGKTFVGKINGLMTYAKNHKKEFPDGGLPTLVKELGFLIGVPIHYYAAVDLEGFSKMIDRVGGVTINNPKAINDPVYGGWTDGRIGFRLSKGKHKLDGQEALAYVRSRKGIGESDFSRARRQQQLLIALEEKLTDPAMLPKLPDILNDAKDTLITNFPADRLGDMLKISERVDEKNITRKVLNAPYSNRPPLSTTGGLYILKLDMKRLAKLSVDLFGEDSRYYVPPVAPSASPSPSTAP
jgi:polyisoprenyl-teichoic acid--peptidoglycan teichoic acid transferase